MQPEEMIKEIVKEVISQAGLGGEELLTVSVSVSARHLHVSREHLDELFGPGYRLTFFKDLSQPGQFAAQEQVSLIGPKGVIQGVRILGPARKKTQVELSRTDCFALGLKEVPVRDSGQVEGSSGITISGPQGTVVLNEGVMVAKRHLHITPPEAEKYNLKDKEMVKVKIEGERALLFDQVLVRVSPEYALDFHLDTDEGNACGFSPGMQGKILR